MLFIFLVAVPYFLNWYTNKSREMGPTGFHLRTIANYFKFQKVKPKTHYDMVYRMTIFVEMIENFGL